MTLTKESRDQPPIMMNERRKTWSIEKLSVLYCRERTGDLYTGRQERSGMTLGQSQTGDSLPAGSTKPLRPTLTLPPVSLLTHSVTLKNTNLRTMEYLSYYVY